MSQNRKRVFSAERSTKAARNDSATMADVLDGLTSLEDRLHQKISDQFRHLSEKLDVAVEDKAETSVDEIMAEIHAMNDHIATTKNEIAALKPVDEANTSISLATGELAEVVKATEDAANTILENTEKIDFIASTIRNSISENDPDGIEPHVDQLEYIGMELLTACSFQDITGQRINKVVNSLNYIEERLQKMIEIWRIEHGTGDAHDMTFAKDDERIDKDLLHGPQTQDTGMAQDDIDALFD